MGLRGRGANQALRKKRVAMRCRPKFCIVATCGKKFTPRSGRPISCSPDCAAERKRLVELNWRTERPDYMREYAQRARQRRGPGRGNMRPSRASRH
jgi:hypothetical protein